VIRTAKAPAATSPAGNLIGPEIVVSLAEIFGVDPCNARQTEPTDVDAMAAQLREQGQIHPLLLRRVPGHGYAVLAGRRRWLGFLHNAGDAPGAVSVRARVFNGGDSEAREASLIENFGREELHPLDLAERFAELTKSLGVDRVARDFGAPRRFVRERLALAALSARVRAAWRSGRIGLDAAKAFATARDEAEQEALLDAPDFAQLAATPLEIRRRLSVRAAPASAPAALFVGAAAYVAAGGTIRDDLFGEEPRFLDRALLERLEREKLAAAAAALRAAEGWGFVVDDPVGEACRRVDLDLRPDERQRLTAIDQAIDEAKTPDAAAALLDERDAIDRVASLRAVALADRHRFGLAVSVDADGRLMVERGLARADAQSSLAESPLADDADALPPRAASPGEPADPRPSIAAGRSPPPPRDRGAMGARVPLDAPLNAAARRVAETAATRALADEVAAYPEYALMLCVAAFAVAGPHKRPVGVRREQSLRGVKTRALVELRRLSFAEALTAIAAWPSAELLPAFAECVAASLDLREAHPDDARALLRETELGWDADSDAPQRPASLRAAIVAAFDYPAFFRAATRADAQRAIFDCGGEALERGKAWMADDDLAAEAALIAHGKSWLPSCVDVLAGAP